MKILVTGAEGQLGSDIRQRAAHHPQWEFHCIDIRDVDLTDSEAAAAFFKGHSYDWVINTAAYTAVDRAETDVQGARAGNVVLVENLVDIIRPKGSYLIHLSTDYVFDGTSSRPYKENDIPNPQSVYGHTKLEGEKRALHYQNAMVVRTSWLYSSLGQNFMNSILRKAKSGEPLKVVNDQFGTPTYAGHLADAIIHKIEGGTTFQPGVFHFSNSGTCSWFDFARAILSEAGLDVSVTPIDTNAFPTAAKRPAYSVLSKHKLIQTFNIQIPHWKDGLRECLRNLVQ